ncbi:hypothetical protein ACKI10_47205, partial [Streptomyces galilaeus]|uniref:hypothetical protein n=1 Tax=Streptomyces galilaeus TaxID=33899 RepID=UPI0038F6B772
MTVLDACSSAPWFDGFDPRAGPRPIVGVHRGWSLDLVERPVARPRTWLLRTGWRKRGLIRPT